MLEDTFVAAKTSWSIKKTKGHQIVTTVRDQDHIEESLPSSLMEEEEEHVLSFKKTWRQQQKEWLDIVISSCGLCHQCHVTSRQGVMSRCIWVIIFHIIRGLCNFNIS